MISWCSAAATSSVKSHAQPVRSNHDGIGRASGFLSVFVRPPLRCDAALTTGSVHRTIVITGATSGIGKLTALHLLKQGATVIMAVRDTAKANTMLAKHAQGLAGRAEVMKCDVG